MPKLHIVTNCGPCESFVERCVASIRSQTYSNWESWVTVDPCGDATVARAIAAAKGEPRIHIHRNQTRKYSLHNLVRSIGRCGALPEDVIVCLDGDDWFSREDALRIIAEAYEQTDCWITYGSWLSNVPRASGGYDGLWPAYPEGTEDFRNHRFLGTAVRTWKRWIWNLIHDDDLRGDSGNYARVSEDQMIMIPLLEMCGTARARHIAAPLMVYNRLPTYVHDPSITSEGLRNGELIAARRRYPRLCSKPAPEQVERSVGVAKAGVPL